MAWNPLHHYGSLVRLGIATAAVATLSLAPVGCKKDKADEGGADEVPGDKAKRGVPQRLEPATLSPLGSQPGFLADAPIYAAAVAGPMQGFFQSLPLPGEVMRELSSMRRDLGFDPINDDLLERFSIPADGVISMTLARPLGRDRMQAIRSGLDNDNRFLTALKDELNERDGVAEIEAVPAEIGDPASPIAYAPDDPPLAKIKAEPVPVPVPPSSGPPSPPVFPVDPGVSALGLTAPPPPEPLSASQQAALTALLDDASVTGLQFHIHVPTTNPSAALSELRAKIPPKVQAKGDAVCAGFEVELCAAEWNTLFIVRKSNDALQFDLIEFLGVRDAKPSARKPALKEALEASPASLAALDSLAGHGSLYLDAERWAQMVELEMVARAVDRITWSGDDVQDSVRRQLDRTKSLAPMLDTQRLFDGLLLRGHHDAERSQLLTSWRLRPSEAVLAARTLLPPPVRVPVPSLAALCDDALMCGRSRGVPTPSTLGSELATGIYGDFEALDDAMDDLREPGAVLLMAATWPNALGALGWHLPLSQARGPEAAFVRGIVDAVGRVQALGFSVEQLNVGRRSISARYGAFARVPIGDMSLVRTLLSMAGERPSPVEVEGLEGVTRVEAPDDDIPAMLLFHEDAEPVKIEGEEVRHGWLAVANAADRLAWLEGMATDGGEAPLAYFEIPDLWQLAMAVPEAMRELAFARTWAQKRSFKAALVLDSGVPTLMMQLAKKSEG